MKINIKHLGSDIPASIVVFLVALPLCLGVAVASGADPFAGVVAGVIGGMVVGLISGSNLSVSGPAAGLTSIVAMSIESLGAYELFLTAVVIAGILQVLLGIVKGGIIGDFIPNSVIKGMLAAIGIILILKQIPHFFGYDVDPEGDNTFIQPDNKNTFTEILESLTHITPLAVVIGLIGIAILIVFEQKKIKQAKWSIYIPAPLLVVLAGIIVNEYALSNHAIYAISNDHLVNLPVFHSIWEVTGKVVLPNLNGIGNYHVWITGFTIAIVASVESLLSLEAVDAIDPQKNISPSNRELIAQGSGNIVSGLIGGIPVTSVIVRSSANVNAGGKTKASSILHGLWLLLSVLFIAPLLNKIPLAALAAILIFTGYKLAKISLFTTYYKKGMNQFLPFLITVLAIVFTDLLKGVAIGIIVGLFYTIRSNFRTAITMYKDEFRYLIRFKKEVTFLNKGTLKKILTRIPDNSAVLIDPTKADFVDADIKDLVNDFIIHAPARNVRVYIKKLDGKEEIFDDSTKNILK